MNDKDFLSLTPAEKDFWRYKFEHRLRNFDINFVVPLLMTFGYGFLVLALYVTQLQGAIANIEIIMAFGSIRALFNWTMLIWFIATLADGAIYMYWAIKEKKWRRKVLEGVERA